MKAVGYQRVSTDYQADSGLGLDAQTAAIAATAKRLGLELAGCYTDAGVSGTVALEHRPGLMDALQQLGKGDVLLVAKRDRLGRDVLTVLLIERAVEAKRARVVSCAGEGTDDDGATSKLLRSVLDAVAQFERAQIAARTRAALTAKRARGGFTGKPRFGTRMTQDGRTEPDEAEAATLARLRSLRSQGLSLGRTADALNQAGCLTRAGSLWRPQYVASLERRHATA